MSLIVCHHSGRFLINLSMKQLSVTPTRAGQICRIACPLEDEDPHEVFIVAEDPSPFSNEDDIYIVNLKDLQRNISAPQQASQIAVQKKDLTVIAEDIAAYVDSWNERS